MMYYLALAVISLNSLLIFSSKGEDVKLDLEQIKNDLMPTFHDNIHTFSENILQADVIRRSLDADLSENAVKLLNETRVFNDIVNNIQEKLLSIHESLENLKNTFESELNLVDTTKSKPTNGPTPKYDTPHPCCGRGSGQEDTRGYTYGYRYRENVDMSNVCIGSRGELIPYPAEVWNRFDTMKVRMYSLSE